MRTQNQIGQGFAGFTVVILAVLFVAFVIQKNLMRVSQGAYKSQYKDLAVEVARSGFVATHAWFRRNVSDLSTASPIPVTTTADLPWPDDAFRPQAEDTDYYELISTTAYDGSPVASAIIRSFPMHITGPAEARSPGLWGRYVIQRQAVRNFTPGANTASVKTLPEAVHDLSGMRSPGGTAGGATVWGITSRSYLYSWPGDLSDTALHQGGSLLGRPLDKVPVTYSAVTLRGRALLLASAKVYGEVVGLKVTPQSLDVPLQVARGNNVTISGAKALVDGSMAASSKAIARQNGDATLASISGGGVLLPAAGPYTNWAYSGGGPSLSNVFPGFGLNDLSNIADYVGDVNIFPDHKVSPGSTAYELFKRRASAMTFYFLNGNAVFPSDESRRMLGVGLIFVNGNLTIENGNASDWAGIVYVNGSVNMSSGSVSGILIATGNVAVNGGTVLSTRLSSNREVATNVRDWIFAYRVNKASVLTQ